MQHPFETSHLFLPDATLEELFTPAHNENRIGPHRLRVSLPREVGLEWPGGGDAYMDATLQLRKFIQQHMAGSLRPRLRDSYYAHIAFKERGTALVAMRYQQVEGGRWLCVRPQAEVLAFFGGVLKSSDR